MDIHKDTDRKAWYLDTEANGGWIDQVLAPYVFGENRRPRYDSKRTSGVVSLSDALVLFIGQ